MVSAKALSDELVLEQRAARRLADPLAQSLFLYAQKTERSAIARVALREAELCAREAGVGRRESTQVRDCESLVVGAARTLRLAADELAQQLRETIREELRGVLAEELVHLVRAETRRGTVGALGAQAIAEEHGGA